MDLLKASPSAGPSLPLWVDSVIFGSTYPRARSPFGGIVGSPTCGGLTSTSIRGYRRCCPWLCPMSSTPHGSKKSFIPLLPCGCITWNSTIQAWLMPRCVSGSGRPLRRHSAVTPLSDATACAEGRWLISLPRTWRPSLRTERCWPGTSLPRCEARRCTGSRTHSCCWVVVLVGSG